MSLFPFERHEDAPPATLQSAMASPAQQKDLLLSVLSRAASINTSIGTSSRIVGPSPRKSSSDRLKKRIKDLVASETTARIEEMNRMTKIALSRSSDGDESHGHYFGQQKGKAAPATKEHTSGNKREANLNLKDVYPSTGTSSSDLLLTGSIACTCIPANDKRRKISNALRAASEFSTPLALQDGRPMLSPPPPPHKCTSSTSSAGEEVSAKDFIASLNLDPTYSSPVTTANGCQFQCQPQYTAPWLLQLNKQPKHDKELVPGSSAKQQVQQEEQKVDKPKQLQSLGSGLTRSSSKGGLLRNRLVSKSKLAPSRSACFSISTKRFSISFNSLLHVNEGASCAVPGEDNRPRANADWGSTACIPSAKLPWSLHAQEHQAPLITPQECIAFGVGTAPSKLVPSHKDSQSNGSRMARLNKSLGNLSLRGKVATPEEKECPGASATSEKFPPPKLTLSRSRSSLGSLRSKKVSPAVVISPSPNAAWGGSRVQYNSP